jgi:uncharacterized protein
MARHELADAESAALGQANTSSEALLELGLMYATGRSVQANLISAHKWFNLAAMRGNQEAVCYRREIAAEMSEADIALAQRAARDWILAH